MVRWTKTAIVKGWVEEPPNRPDRKPAILEANTSRQKCPMSRDGVLNARDGHIFGTAIFFCQSGTRGEDYLTVWGRMGLQYLSSMDGS